MKNFVFISPNFPVAYWKFCAELKNNGLRVLGIGDCPYDELKPELRESLHEYYKVANLENYDEVFRAVAFFTYKYGKIDWLESNNEYWLERDAKLRTEFNIITGFKQEEMEKVKCKSAMKRSKAPLLCGRVEIQGKKAKDLSSFDIDNLRWNKVVICTDADYDGFQIRTLILTMIYRLCPTLIRDGYVYIAESPLFEITCKDKTWFAYNEPEKAKILKELDGQKVKIQRSKGLGENDPEMMWMTTMNPETRRLIKVMPEDAERTAYYFDVLLGDELQARKNFIAENGAKYLDLADIS